MKNILTKIRKRVGAYTLAEVLITLGIIGVVIATVLPSFFVKGSFFDILIIIAIFGLVFGAPLFENFQKSQQKNSYKQSRTRKSKKSTEYIHEAEIVNDSTEDFLGNFTEKSDDFGQKINDTITSLGNIFKPKGEKMEKNNLAGMVTVIVLFVIAVLLCNPIVVVGVGERGVKVTLGKVSPASLGEGMHVIMPYIQRIAKLDVKTQKYSTETHVYTKDIQQAKISYVVNYNLQSDCVHKMYQEVGIDYVSKVINPIIEGNIKDVIGKWNAQDLVANREEAASEIFMKLRNELTPKYVNVSTFQIVDINYSDVFEHAIESKVTAEQEALKAKNKTVQIQEEAKQKVISAEAEAKSMSIRANALTQNKALVEYEAVQKWNGVLPEYMMGNSVPFINLNK